MCLSDGKACLWNHANPLAETADVKPVCRICSEPRLCYLGFRLLNIQDAIWIRRFEPFADLQKQLKKRFVPFADCRLVSLVFPLVLGCLLSQEFGKGLAHAVSSELYIRI